MSEGDVMRLNRMYKCGPQQTQPLQQSIYTHPMPALNGVKKEENSSDSSGLVENGIEMSKQKNAKLFGIFIFKDIGGN
jgi:hypothetical protein